MTRTFNCASCSAPLEFSGEMMQKCGHCGSTVIAPPELFYAASPRPFNDLSSLTGKALKIAEIQQLIHDGQKIEAIKVFRETFGVGLKEAKDAVEAMERGESIDISGMQIRSTRLRGNTIDGDAVKKIGMTVGGSVIALVLIFTILIIGAVAAVLYFSFGTAITAIDKVDLKPSRPMPKGGEAPPVSELLKIGGEGNGVGKFKDNRHVAVDGNGRIYSSDYSPYRVQVFDAEGKFVNRWNTESDPEIPRGTNLYDLAADRQGNLFVANDKGLFKHEGETGKLIATAEKTYPRGIALTTDGKVVVVVGKTISIYDSSLKLLAEIKDAAKRANSTFGFEHVAVDGDGVIYTLERTGSDICKFSPDGKFLNRFGSGTGSPKAIAIDPKGRIFVSEASRIKVLDANGAALDSFDTNQAFGMAFDQNGELFVASRPYVVKYGLDF